ncbi:hypothetical protein [Streptomyces virginiae]|uniref:hypothetical protein n=1 Tax=Streptomyces virginiae TaxID=1961 RepID=UPI003686AEBB
MIHCEVWAGTPEAPYTWLLARQDASTARRAVRRRLVPMALRLAERLDDDPDTTPIPAAVLRAWESDALTHEDAIDALTRGQFVPAAVSVIAGSVLYTLAAMPANQCACLLPRPLADIAA